MGIRVKKMLFIIFAFVGLFCFLGETESIGGLLLTKALALLFFYVSYLLINE